MSILLAISVFSSWRAGAAEWDGVRNHQASNNMKAMKRGDRAFFYHSVNEKRIVGIVEVVKEYYPDPSDASARFGMVGENNRMPARTGSLRRRRTTGP